MESTRDPHALRAPCERLHGALTATNPNTFIYLVCFQVRRDSEWVLDDVAVFESLESANAFADDFNASRLYETCRALVHSKPYSIGSGWADLK